MSGGRFLWVALAAGLLAVDRVGLAEDDGARPSADLVVIVSDQVALTDLSLVTLRRIYTQGKVSISSQAQLIPINAAPHSPERVHFDRIVLGMEPEAVGRYWIDQKIRGAALPPKSVGSRALAVKIAERVQGAITYVVNGPLPPGTHVVTIEGKRPGDAGYVLAR